MKLERIVIVGLGLIGGSVVKALRARDSASFIAGVDDEETLARARGWLDEGALPASPSALALLRSADLVVLATPGRVILEGIGPTLDALRPDAALTDTASVKLAIVERGAAHPRFGRFVPGHPMAGREVGGFDASRADLFENAAWFLVESGADADAFERVRSLVLALGAEPRVVKAEQHDRAMALVSHLPHLLASALVELATDAGVLDFAGPGFRDTTRIAGGPDAIWGDIFAENRAFLVPALDALLRRLDGVKEALATGEREGVAAALELLAAARRARGDTSGQGGSG